MILITGATGFLGRHVTNTLITEGHDIKVISRNPEKARSLFPRARIVKGDILSPETLDLAMKDVNKVIHLAGLISYSLPKEELFKFNVQGTKNLLEAANNVEKIIFSSSVSVYGETWSKASEFDQVKPRNHYGQSKLEAEKAIQDSGIPNLMYRLSVVYGNNSPIWNNIMKFFSKGFPLPRTKNNTNLIHTTDVSKAFSISVNKGTGIFNLAGEKNIPFVELASLLAYHLDMKPKFWPVWLVKFMARFKGKSGDIETFIQNRNYDISKAEQDLGFKPEAFLEKEIKNMVEYYRKSINNQKTPLKK